MIHQNYIDHTTTYAGQNDICGYGFNCSNDGGNFDTNLSVYKINQRVGFYFDRLRLPLDGGIESLADGNRDSATLIGAKRAALSAV